MKKRTIQLFLFCLSMMVISVFVRNIGEYFVLVQASATRAPVTTITVTTTADFDNSNVWTCESRPEEPCTLRRAIIQARNAAKPAVIAFDISTEDPGYNSSLKVWVFDDFKITTVDGPSTIFRSLTGGQITIDGSTQPGGRDDGPSIILVGPGNGSNSCFNLSAGTNNVVRGIAFQNFRDSITISSTDSLIEDNWFGLNAEGTLPEWRNPNDKKQGSGATGIVMFAGADNNTIQNNVFLGLNGTATTIRGNNNTFANNLVGTTAVGLTPGKETEGDLVCTEWDWYGGSGIRLDGNDHVIEDNIFTGIRLDLFETSTQPEAIYIGGTCNRVVVQNNKIGVDSAGEDMGVCGRGINIFDAKQAKVENNEIADTRSSAFFLNGSNFRDLLLSQNIIRKSTPWLWPEGQDTPDEPILRFKGLPDAYEFFNPAQVTSIEGKTVKGTSGVDSPCPDCKIELFLDKDDDINQAIEYLGSTTADANGDWTFTLAAELKQDEGIRTTSTTTKPMVISGMGPNTTVGLSELYQPDFYSGLILNGSFEDNPPLIGWVYGGELPVLRSTHAAHGNYSLQLGSPVAQNEQGQGKAWAYQTIFVPPDWDKPMLSFQYNMFVNDIIHYSDFKVAIQDVFGLNELVDVLRDGFEPCLPDIPPQQAGTNLGWRTVTHNLSAYKGQHIRLVFSNENLWPASFGIWTFVDDVRVLEADDLLPLASVPPSIISLGNTTFRIGAEKMFTLVSQGYPMPTLSLQGTLPEGVTFISGVHGTACFAGIPKGGTDGIYNLTITANNGVSPAATQAFTMNVSIPVDPSHTIFMPLILR